MKRQSLLTDDGELLVPINLDVEIYDGTNKIGGFGSEANRKKVFTFLLALIAVCAVVIVYMILTPLPENLEERYKPIAELPEVKRYIEYVRQAIPQNATYDDVLPLKVGSVSRRRVFAGKAPTYAISSYGTGVVFRTTIAVMYGPDAVKKFNKELARFDL